MIQVVNPTTLEVIGEFPIPSQEEIGNILKRLREGNLRWSRKDINQRLEILKNIRRVIINDADRIATTITKNTGKPIFESYSSEILPVCLIIEFFTKTVPDVLSTRHLRLPFFPWVGRKSEVEFRPYGIIGVISPWNFPFLLPMSQILCALACGNCVVFKPSSVTAVVGKLIDEIFREAGIKEDVFCTVIGDATTGTAIIKQKVDKIFFTGSVETGKRIMELCAQNLTPVVLELGGKNPMLVLNDANIDYAVDGAMWGGFTNSGQVCASVERVIVDRKIFEEFVKKLVYKTQKLRQSDPLDPHTDIGSLCCKSQFETVCHLVEDAKNQGARILTGGEPADLKGYFYKPTIITHINKDAKIMQEEIFGPVLLLFEAENLEDAIKIANDSSFGLCASVWSKNISLARKVASKIQCGSVMINDCASAYAICQGPWGGFKDSGIGRIHSSIGILEFVQPVHINVNLLKMRPLWWYNYNTKILEFTRKVIQKAFSRKPFERISIVKDIIGQIKD